MAEAGIASDSDMLHNHSDAKSDVILAASVVGAPAGWSLALRGGLEASCSPEALLAAA